MGSKEVYIMEFFRWLGFVLTVTVKEADFWQLSFPHVNFNNCVNARHKKPEYQNPRF